MVQNNEKNYFYVNLLTILKAVEYNLTNSFDNYELFGS